MNQSIAKRMVITMFMFHKVHPIIFCSCKSLTFVVVVFFNSFWVMPAFVLKKMIMNNFTTAEVDEDIADSIDFMVERVSKMHIT